MIKCSLDRKGRVASIKQKVEETINHSKMEVEVAKSRSPQRSRSPFENQTNHQMRSSGTSLTQAYLQQNNNNMQTLNFTNHAASNQSLARQTLQENTQYAMYQANAHASSRANM